MNTTTSPKRMTGMSMSPPRVVSAVLGVWLFISAFIWPHTSAQMTNTWICGVLAVIFALAAGYSRQARYLNTVLAVWLFISTFALPSMRAGTLWNNVIVAILLFISSLMAGGRTTNIPRTVAT